MQLARGTFNENRIKNKQARGGDFRSRFDMSTSDDAYDARAMHTRNARVRSRADNSENCVAICVTSGFCSPHRDSIRRLIRL